MAEAIFAAVWYEWESEGEMVGCDLQDALMSCPFVIGIRDLVAGLVKMEIEDLTSINDDDERLTFDGVLIFQEVPDNDSWEGQ